MISIAPETVVQSLIRDCAARQVRREGRANSQAIDEESVVALDAHPCPEIITSSVAVDQAVWIRTARFADVVRVHRESRQAPVAAIDSTAIGVAESAIPHKSVVGVGYCLSATVVENVSVTRLAVLADIVTVVVNAVWGSSSSYTSISRELGSSAEGAEISVDAVVASCTAFIAEAWRWKCLAQDRS